MDLFSYKKWVDNDVIIFSFEMIRRYTLSSSVVVKIDIPDFALFFCLQLATSKEMIKPNIIYCFISRDRFFQGFELQPKKAQGKAFCKKHKKNQKKSLLNIIN